VSTEIENENALKCLNDTAAQETIKLGRNIGDVTWEMASKAIDKVCLYSAICWHVILTASLLISVVS
jgi:hypothetical protein